MFLFGLVYYIVQQSFFFWLIELTRSHCLFVFKMLTSVLIQCLMTVKKDLALTKRGATLVIAPETTMGMAKKMEKAALVVNFE